MSHLFDRIPEQQSKVLGGLRNSSETQAALRGAGITEKRLAKVIDEGLDPTRFFSANFKLHEVPDQQARHAFAKTAAQLLDVMPAKMNLHGIVDPEELLDVAEGEAVVAPWGDAAPHSA